MEKTEAMQIVLDIAMNNIPIGALPLAEDEKVRQRQNEAVKILHEDLKAQISPEPEGRLLVDFELLGTLQVPVGSKIATNLNRVILPSGETISVYPTVIVEPSPTNHPSDDLSRYVTGYSELRRLGVSMDVYKRHIEEVASEDPRGGLDRSLNRL